MVQNVGDLCDWGERIDINDEGTTKIAQTGIHTTLTDSAGCKLFQIRNAKTVKDVQIEKRLKG